MEEDRLLTLLDSYLEGRLTPEDRAELEAELIRSPEAREVYWDCLDQHAMLRQIVLKAKGRAFAVRRRRLPRWVFGSVAAALLLGIGLYFLWPGETRPTVARLEEVKGRVEIVSGEDRSAAASGTSILMGQGLETLSADSGATLLYPDGTRVKASPRTVLRNLSGNGSGKSVALAKGAVAATVARQPEGRPMVFTTPQGSARVLGTTLRLVVENGSKGLTRLEVNEGKVRLTRLDGDTVDVASGHYAVAAAGVDLVAKPIVEPAARPSGRDLISRMEPNSWLSVPGTDLLKVVPDPAKYPRIQGIMGPRGIMESWSGGALDTNRSRLIVWGGGATNYRGNEIYAFDLNTLQWQRLTDPSPDPANGEGVNPDGNPNARDTFNGLAYVSHTDRLFAMGGALSGTAAKTGADISWMFDFGSGHWIDPKPAGARPRTGEGDSCAYDAVTRKVWFLDANHVSAWGLYSLDVDANRWTKHSDDSLASRTCAMDTSRGLLVAVGRGDVSAFDVRGIPTRQIWKTSGGDKFAATHGPGFDYDPGRDRFFGWAGGPVYALDPGTRTWTAFDPPGAPKPTQNGIYGRWRYVPGLDVFVVATTIERNVHFYKPVR